MREQQRVAVTRGIRRGPERDRRAERSRFG
jgi:hypothetical protein